MINRAEGYFLGDPPRPLTSVRNPNELFYQSWTNPKGKAHATLVLTHGIAEHSEAYNQFAQDFCPRGWDIYAMDLRGHGKSEGRRGYIDDFGRFSRDLKKFIEYLQTGPLSNSKIPLYLLGHSMGGLITLNYLVDNFENSPAQALLLSSPALGISMPVPKIKEMAAGLLLKYLPQVTLPNAIRYDHLTHIKEIWEKYPGDPLRHDKISPAMYFGMTDGFANAFRNAEKIKIPTLIQIAGDEKIVSRSETERFFEKLKAPNKKLFIYEKSYHEIFNDFEREQVMEDLHHYLLSMQG